MIEPIIGDKQCSKCGECKPRTEFHADYRRVDGMHRQCKACRLAQAHRRTMERTRSDYRAVKRPRRAAQDSPTAWLLPADPRPFGQQLANATQRKWRYPVEPAQLRWMT